MNERLSINQAGLNLIKEFEGCCLVSYMDNGGWAIGYGHTSNVQSGQVIGVDTALKFLNEDLSIAEAVVSSLVSFPLSENQFSALVSFVFNLGREALATSTLRAKLNSGDLKGASEEFTRWDKISGTPNAGVLRRRTAEQALFLTP